MSVIVDDLKEGIMRKKINWRKGSSDMLELTVTILGLVGFFILFFQIVTTVLSLMTLEDASFEIARKLVVCESLDDEDDENSAVKTAEKLAEELFKDNDLILHVDTTVVMADTVPDRSSAQPWKKGNFATLYLRGYPKNLTPYSYLTIEYTFMIEND